VIEKQETKIIRNKNHKLLLGEEAVVLGKTVDAVISLALIICGEELILAWSE
jgi:hypothetical protein